MQNNDDTSVHIILWKSMRHMRLLCRVSHRGFTDISEDSEDTQILVFYKTSCNGKDYKYLMF